MPKDGSKLELMAVEIPEHILRGDRTKDIVALDDSHKDDRELRFMRLIRRNVRYQGTVRNVLNKVLVSGGAER